MNIHYFETTCTSTSYFNLLHLIMFRHHHMSDGILVFYKTTLQCYGGTLAEF